MHYIDISAMGHRTARAIVAGAVACSMGAMGAIYPSRALADDGAITITQRASQHGEYNMYRVFIADISEDDLASHVSWSEENRAAALSFLDKPASETGADMSYAEWLAANGLEDEDARENAQNAAEYISRMIASSANAVETAEPPIKLSGSFAENFAQHMGAFGTKATPAATTNGIPYVNTEGYYLAVSNAEAIGSDEAGSAPMWIPLGGSMQTIDAKEDAPTTSFQVCEDRDGSSWGKAADSSRGQDLAFRIRGTLPSNVNAFDRFHDRYVVQLAEGVSLAAGDTSSVIVTLNGTDVTSQVTITYEGSVLIVDSSDLRSLVRHQTQYLYQNDSGNTIHSLVPLAEAFPGEDYPYIQEGTRYRFSGEEAVNGSILESATGGTGIEISYSAHLNASAVAGEEGNVSHVERTYTSDPITLADSNATSQMVVNYAYEGQILKTDKSNRRALAGASYSIRVSDGHSSNKDGSDARQAPPVNSDTASAGLYVQADGSLGSSPHLFETNAQGEIDVPAIDEGVYVIREEAAPAGYDLQDTDIILQIESELDQTTGELTTLEARVSGGEAANVTGDESTKLISVAKSSGATKIQAVDDRLVELASTGLAGNGAFYITAGVLAGAGTAGLAATRRRTNGRK